MKNKIGRPTLEEGRETEYIIIGTLAATAKQIHAVAELTIILGSRENALRHIINYYVNQNNIDTRKKNR